MSWTGWPLVAGTSNLQHYPLLRQLWEAIRERRAVAGQITAWPPSNFPWASGRTITSVTDNGDGTISFTDSAASADFGGTGWVDFAGNKRWTGCSAFDLNG